MSDSINLVNDASALDTAPALSPFTGVKLWCDDETYFFSGDETGRVLEAEFPWATQAIADSVLASISGFVYQPFSAQNALLDPAAEIGDGVSVGGVYSVLAAVDTKFDALFASNISAPSDEEIDHEYHYVKPEKRLEKRVSKMMAEFRVMSDRIEGVVEDMEGNIAEFEQTAEKIDQRVTNAENEISEISLSIDGISQSVSNAEGMATEALQTAEGFSERITDAEGNIAAIEFTLEGVAYTSSLAEGTTVINGGCIKTGTIDAERINTDNLKVDNGNITSLDVGKLTVNGAAISASNPWDNAYHRNVFVSQNLSTGDGGEIELTSIADGYTRLDPYGITAACGLGTQGYVAWTKLVDMAENGGSSTAVFG